MNKYQYKVQGVDYDVEIEEVEGNVAKVIVNGIRFDVELKQPINPTSTLKKVRVEAPKPVARPSVAPAPAATPAPAAPAAAGAGSPIKAPLPGTITELKVNVGDTVKKGDTWKVPFSSQLDKQLWISDNLSYRTSMSSSPIQHSPMRRWETSS